MFDRVEADQADAGIELDMGAHMHGAVADAALQRLAAARVNVLDRELLLGRRGDANGLRDRALLDMAAIHDAGLVEMDMGLDHAGQDETGFGIDFPRVGVKISRDGRDHSTLDADIGDTKRALLHEAGIANNEVHQFTEARSAAE